MAKKDKPFQNVNSALSHIWGTPISAQNQGSRVLSSTQRAGVKIDAPLTKTELEAQKIIDELIAEEQAAAKAADPRSDFEKKYDIKDNTAHVTTDMFRGLLVSNKKLRHLMSKVGNIYIEDGFGSSAEFVPYSPEQRAKDNADSKHPEIVPSETFLKFGIAGTLKNESMVLIGSKAHCLGALKRKATPTDLAFHARITQTATEFTGINHHLDEVIVHTGNLKQKMWMGEHLEAELHEKFDEGIPLTVSTHAKRTGGPIRIGTLRHPDSISTSHLDLEEIPCGALLQRDIIVPLNRNPAEFLSDFFNKKSGFAVTFKKRIVAILLHEPPAP